MEKWTESEDEIIRQNTLKASALLLKHRTYMAVASRRSAIGVAPISKATRWSKREDNVLRRYASESVRDVRKRLPNRTEMAIRFRRQLLGLGRRTHKVVPWKTTELSRLKKMWLVASKAELAAAFPNRTWQSLAMVASKLSLRKREESRFTNLLAQEVRKRCREDGIAVGALTSELGLPRYYLQQRRTHKLDLNKLAKIVEFFGGRLRIDWQDE